MHITAVHLTYVYNTSEWFWVITSSWQVNRRAWTSRLKYDTSTGWLCKLTSTWCNTHALAPATSVKAPCEGTFTMWCMQLIIQTKPVVVVVAVASLLLSTVSISHNAFITQYRDISCSIEISNFKITPFWDMLPCNLVDTLLSWIWKQHIPLKRWYLCTKQHNHIPEESLELMLQKPQVSKFISQTYCG